MILQSLAKLAEREGLVDDPHYETKDVHWRVSLNREGRFVCLEALLQSGAQQFGNRRSPRGLPSLVPRPFPGAKMSGTKPDSAFMVGNASFVCGLDLTDEQKYAERNGELARRMMAFHDLLERAVQDCLDDGLAAVRRFLNESGELERLRQQTLDRVKAKELAPHHLLAFGLVGDAATFVHLRPPVMRYWATYRSKLAAGEHVQQCLVTGIVGPTVDKHPSVKKLPGGTPSGVAVVSFNENAFESFGFSRNENAPVSRQAAEAYTAALNRLLDPESPDPRNRDVRLPVQRVQLSSNTVAVFWTDEPNFVAAALAPALDSADPDAMSALGIAVPLDERYGELNARSVVVASPQPVADTHAAPWTGIRPEELADPGAFRLLILSGGQGRATIRSFHTSRVQETVIAVRRWFDDIELATRHGRPALYRLLSSLAVRSERDRLSPNLAGDLFLAILSGHPLPLSVLENAVRRCRTEADTGKGGSSGRGQKAPYERAALIKAYLNRSQQTIEEQQGIRFQEIKAVMNTDERNRGYLLGRMFACIERMQELALGEVGANVTDRYFGAACATPQAVFPRLLKTEVHHFRKAADGRYPGAAHREHSEISRLATWLVGEENGLQLHESLDAFFKRTAGRPLRGFPVFLPLVEQGLFVLGYHQQRAERFKKREAAEPGGAGIVPADEETTS